MIIKEVTSIEPLYEVLDYMTIDSKNICLDSGIVPTLKTKIERVGYHTAALTYDGSALFWSSPNNNGNDCASSERFSDSVNSTVGRHLTDKYSGNRHHGS